MYSKAEIDKKHLEALARKQKNLALRASQNNVQNNCANPNPVASSNPFNSSRNSKAAEVPKKSFNFGKNDNNKSVAKNHIHGNRFNPISAKPFYGVQEKVSVKATMISPTRFALICSSYNQEFIDICKSIKSKVWDVKTKQWNFGLQDYDETIQKFADNKQFAITSIPHHSLKVFRRALDMKQEDVDISRIEKTILDMAKPFQIEGIKYGIAKGGRVMIADDMGLGKTIQALGIAHYYRDSWPMLIVTPSSIRYQWTEAIYKHLPSVPAQMIQQVSTTKDFIGSNLITIISYDMLSRMIDEIEKKVFGVIIVDESHFLKSYKSMRTKAVTRISQNANHIILLSGTPALSRPIELYSQIALLKKDFMPYHEYGKRYCAGIHGPFGWNFNGSSYMQELQEYLKLLCLVRRMKSEVLKQLPDKMRQVIILDPEHIASATRAMRQASQSLQEAQTKSEKHSLLLTYYSETAKAKSPAVCKYVADLIEGETKFLIFSHHKHMMNAICELLESKKKKFIRIDGETSAEARNELVNKFQLDSDVLVAVLSITAANAGLNMTSASLVVFAELSWNPGILCQAEDRVHRIGQQNKVVIQYLIARNTADDYLWNLLQKKMEVLQEAGLKQEFSVNETKEIKSAEQPKLDNFLQPTPSEASLADSFKEMEEDDFFDNVDLDDIV